MPSMPHSSVPSQASSDPDEVVVGVDTHKDVHVAAVLTALGVLRESKKFPATAAGYQALLAWVCTFGILRRAGVECTGSYGAALARYLRAGWCRGDRGQPGATKPPAASGARPTPSTPKPLPGRCSAAGPARRRRPVTGQWRCRGVFTLAKVSAVKARTQTINQPESRARRGATPRCARPSRA